MAYCKTALSPLLTHCRYYMSSMAYCKTAVSPLLTHWRYYSLALTHRCVDVSNSVKWYCVQHSNRKGITVSKHSPYLNDWSMACLLGVFPVVIWPSFTILLYHYCSRPLEVLVIHVTCLENGSQLLRTELRHWSLNKLITNLQITFHNPFSWQKSLFYVNWKFTFVKVQLKVSQHWFA